MQSHYREYFLLFYCVKTQLPYLENHLSHVASFMLILSRMCTFLRQNRKTVKSKLYDAAMSELLIINENTLQNISNLQTYYLDPAAAIRTLTGTIGTIREVAWKILYMVLKQFKNIYLVCDTYKEGSIKTGERRARGTGRKYILKSQDMNVPSDFCSFLKNEDNKTMILNIIEQAIIEDKIKLGTMIFFFKPGSLQTNLWIPRCG